MGRSFGTGLAKLLTSVAVLGKELFLNAFSKDPKINVNFWACRFGSKENFLLVRQCFQLSTSVGLMK